jgi:hypothetical protein
MRPVNKKSLNQKLNFFSSAFIFSFIFSVGCNYNVQKLKPNEPTEIQFTTGEELDYKIVSEQVLARACFDCHSNSGSRGINKGDVNLETYENVFSNREDIRNDIIDGSMPKNSAPLSAYQKRLILAWLDAGAMKDARPGSPTTPPVVNPPTTPPPTTPPAPVVVPDIPEDQIYYDSVSKYVLQTNCTKCHKPGGRREDFTNYENVFKNRLEIAEQLDQGEMPPSPPKGIPLTDAQMRLINKWLARGAPEKP